MLFVFNLGQDEVKEENFLSISFQNRYLPECARFDSGHCIKMTASICDRVALCLSYSPTRRVQELLHCTQGQEGGCCESNGAYSRGYDPQPQMLFCICVF